MCINFQIFGSQGTDKAGTQIERNDLILRLDSLYQWPQQNLFHTLLKGFISRHKVQGTLKIMQFSQEYAYAEPVHK